jgi:hypothetical protein
MCPHIRALVKSFRLVQEPYWIAVQEGVRVLSRRFHNEIIDQIRGALWDVDAFALRWVERAWEVALNLHIGLYGVECYRKPLSQETFANAVLISHYFAAANLKSSMLHASNPLTTVGIDLKEFISAMAKSLSLCAISSGETK